VTSESWDVSEQQVRGGGAARTLLGERYLLRKRLGEGASGVVFQAWDRELGVDVALKELRGAGPSDSRELKREFRALAGLAHPNLAQLYELVVTESECFFTMEWVRGRPFPEFARRGGAVAADAVREALWQLGLGLQHLHSHGKLHRDVKPSNVLVEPSGRAVVLDFGFVSELRAEDPAAQSLVGTPAYMSPEQLWGQSLTPAADWWAVGAMVYECFSGRVPADTAEVASGVRPSRLRTLCPDAPADLCALVDDLLEPEPRARPDGRELLRRLRPPRASLPPQDSARVFVGRAAELESLHAALESSRAGAVTVRVGGPSGIGKTSLVEQFARESRAISGAVCLRSRCHPQESVAFPAFDGIVDGLSTLSLAASAGRDLDSRERAVLAKLFPVLSALLGDALRDTSLGEPIRVRRDAFEAVRKLLGRVAAIHPVLLWIDDAQWADPDSERLLEAILREPDAPRVLVVLCGRDDGGHPFATQLADTRALELAPLSSEEARALTRSVFDAEVSTPVRNAIETAAGGSPFLVQELARLWREGSDVEGGAIDARSVVADRLGSLPAQAAAVLELIALGGRPLEREVVLAAAQLAPGDRPVIAALERNRLIRLRKRDAAVALETYHDRIREAVLASLPEPLRRERHLALATTLETRGATEVEELAHHYHGGANLPRAALFAARAGARASDSLAFARSAEWYENALAWGAASHSGAERRELLARRADALVNAGRSADAAPVYLEAAQLGSAQQGYELRRLAAEQLLVSGRVAEGVAVLRPLARELGLSFPRSRLGMGWAGWRAVRRLERRGLDFAERPSAAVDPEVAVRVDLCYSVARGLSAVDPLAGANLPCHGLLLALDHADPARVGRSLAAVGGAVLAPLPGRLGAFGRQMIERAAALGESLADPFLHATARSVRAHDHIVHGRWRGAVVDSLSAIQVLERHCPGTHWERASVRMALLRGLEELGEMREMSARAQRMIDECDDRGDRYGAATGLLFAAAGDLAQDQPARARERIRQARERLPSDGFHIQHFYALRAEAHADLYEGRGDEAAGRVRAGWPQIRRSGLLLVPITRIDARLLAARTSLSSSRARRPVTAELARLSRETRLDVAASTALLEARLALASGESVIAVSHLERAERGFEECEMRIQRDLCRAARARLAGDTAAQDTAELSMRAKGVREPERWAAVFGVPRPLVGAR
jgi:predicted Ser/Thr protein kinase